MMFYTKNDRGDVREIILPESIASVDKADFIEIIDKFLETGFETLLLNFENCEYLDSAGLGFLFIAKQEVSNAKRSLVLKNPNNDVKKMFNILNFEHIFDIE